VKGAFAVQGRMNPKIRFQKKIKKWSLFIDGDDRTFEGSSFIMAKASPYPKKNSLEVGLHLSRHDLEVELHLSRHNRKST